MSQRWTIGLCLLSLFLLGCRAFPGFQKVSEEQERAARALETASVRTWAEGRAAFAGVDRYLAARAWERNLRQLDLKPQRFENFVNGTTPDGHAFCLAFWEDDKGGTMGELLWTPPDGAAEGMTTLLQLERKHRGEKKSSTLPAVGL